MGARGKRATRIKPGRGTTDCTDCTDVEKECQLQASYARLSCAHFPRSLNVLGDLRPQRFGVWEFFFIPQLFQELQFQCLTVKVAVKIQQVRLDVQLRVGGVDGGAV